LVPERVWQEFCRSLIEKNPEQFITVLRTCGALRIVIPELDGLFGIPNSPEDYPGIDSGLKALDALQKTAAVSDDPIVRFAALLHDIGNCDTPMANWPAHQPLPEEVGRRIEAMCQRLRIPREYSHLARMTAQFYRKIHSLRDLDAEVIVQVLEGCDAFRRPLIVEQLLLICDAIANDSLQKHASHWQIIHDKCAKISIQSLIDQGYQGEGIKKGLHQKRVECVEACITSSYWLQQGGYYNQNRVKNG